MSITIGNLAFEGPFLNASQLLARSGVYAILGRTASNDNWKVVDVGEAGDVRSRVESHDRQDQWSRCGHGTLTVAAYYCDEVNRMRVESALRQQYKPPCGMR